MSWTEGSIISAIVELSTNASPYLKLSNIQSFRLHTLNNHHQNIRWHRDYITRLLALQYLHVFQSRLHVRHKYIKTSFINSLSNLIRTSNALAGKFQPYISQENVKSHKYISSKVAIAFEYSKTSTFNPSALHFQLKIYLCCTVSYICNCCFCCWYSESASFMLSLIAKSNRACSSWSTILFILLSNSLLPNPSCHLLTNGVLEAAIENGKLAEINYLYCVQLYWVFLP